MPNASSLYAHLMERRREDADCLYDFGRGKMLSAGDVNNQVRALSERIRSDRKELIALEFGNDIESVVAYLSALHSGHAVAVLPAQSNREEIHAFVERFRPYLVVGRSDAAALIAADMPSEFRACKIGSLFFAHNLQPATDLEIHRDLALLMPTSGTSGSPKYAKLTSRNLTANIDDVVTGLSITRCDRTVTSLPIAYIYGLTVFHTHLRAEGVLGVIEPQLTAPRFWQQVHTFGLNSFAGVPLTYEFLRAMDPARALPPQCRTLTVAGGRLKDETTEFFHAFMERRGGQFITMYGQTEASPRIAMLPHHEALTKKGAAGRAVASGRLTIVPIDCQEPSGVGEVVYEGPNVMAGYAVDRADLAVGDLMGGILRTGDVGYIDPDGVLFLTGRIARFAKIEGKRIGLDDVERLCGEYGDVAAVESGDRICLSCTSPDVTLEDAARMVAKRFSISRRSVVVRFMSEFPKLPNGKVDYRALKKLY